MPRICSRPSLRLSVRCSTSCSGVVVPGTRRVERSVKKSHIGWITLVAVLLLGVPGVGVAQEANTGRLAGVVKDTQGNAFPGAEVVVADEQGHAVFRAFADRTGTWTIAAIPAGTYTVTVTAPATVPGVLKNVTVAAGGSASRGCHAADRAQRDRRRDGVTGRAATVGRAGPGDHHQRPAGRRGADAELRRHHAGGSRRQRRADVGARLQRHARAVRPTSRRPASS